jgi:hypothetical protein
MAPEEMEAAEKKRSPQAWKLRLPWEQQKQAEIQRSAFLQSQEDARASTSSMSTLARAFMISRRRLRLDPDKKLHFLCKRLPPSLPHLTTIASLHRVWGWIRTLQVHQIISSQCNFFF